jgi:hypothetical protein
VVWAPAGLGFCRGGRSVRGGATVWGTRPATFRSDWEAVDIAVDNFVDIENVTGISAGSLAPSLTAAPPRRRKRKGALQCLNHHCVSRETRIAAWAKSSAGVNALVLVGFWGIPALSPWF